MAEVADLRRNKKQIKFFNTVMESTQRYEVRKPLVMEWKEHIQQVCEEKEIDYSSNWRQLQRILDENEIEYKDRPDEAEAYRYFFYGGAIRGGKTFVCLIILILLAKKYKKSRWHIIRKSFPDLEATTIPSFNKLVDNAQVRWNKSKSNYYCEFSNGSRIYFMAENYQNDKDFNRFKGLETNGVLLEQIEELQEGAYSKCLERLGSWYPEDMPPPFLFATFNPTYNWVKEKFHDKWEKSGAHAPFYYLTALPNDNPFVTDEQWENWEQLDDETYDRFVAGDWSMNVTGVFMKQFNDKKHLDKDIRYNPNLPIWLSFDFNVDPMTCLVFQTDKRSYVHCLKEYRIEDSDTYELCEKIKQDYKMESSMVRVTGDATGNARISGARKHISQYQIIKKELGLHWKSFRVPGVNPFISDSRTFCNSFMKSFPSVKINPDTCPWLVKDLRFVMTGEDAKGKMIIQKTGMNPHANIDNKKLGHLLDDFRYFLHTAFPDWVLKIKQMTKS